MAEPESPLIEHLIDRAAGGDDLALQDLLERFRPRLRQMVTLRIDERLAARVDESDVVQEALLIASQRIPEYARARPVPFYPWLRAIAWNRLVDLHRKHILSERRGGTRERRTSFDLSSESIGRVADYLVAIGTHPRGGIMQEKMNVRGRSAWAK